MNLKQSPVRFDNEAHRYFLGSVELQGITGMINRQLFPNKYASVPEEMLRKAAEKGSNVHTDCQMIDLLGGIPSTLEGAAYIKLKNEYNISDLENEYLVSDDEHFATCIDKVDSDLNLYDFKTTYKLDKEYLSWQLSINKYLFGLQTGLQAKNLYAIWLRGEEATLISIEEKSLENVLSLLEAEIKGETYNCPGEAQSAQISQLFDLEQAIIRIKQEADFYEAQKKGLLSGIEQQMIKADTKKIETETLIITRVLPTQSISIDTNRMKKEQPDICKKYEKISERAGYIKLTIKEK
jgi:hypothetical protein